MELLLIGLAAITFISTLTGGLIAVRYRKVLHYFFAFASGSLLAVTFFDILPESLKISLDAGLPMRYIFITVVGFFFLYSLVERFFLTHHYHDGHDKHGHIMGPVGAGGLVIHSFFDGISIGIAYQVSAAIGIIVALAVIFHDFNDGINTITIMLKNKQHVKKAKMFLVADAIAPIIGVILASAFLIGNVILAFILAAFAGEFIYLGTTNLLPETYKHTPWKMALAMLFGILLIFVLTSVV
jgi:ZIP family zinc transporter